jgi:phosphodiesterase/alkaline phosphatase D-like protein
LFSDPIFSSVLTPHSSYKIIRAVVAGLDPDTKYYVSVQPFGGRISLSKIGSFRTPKSGAHSFSFAAASCSQSASNARVFDKIKERVDAGEIDFFVHTGDIHYDDHAVNNESLFQLSFDNAFNAVRQNALWRSVPMYYMWDDHDYGPNDTDRNNPARQAAVAAYRRRVPSPPLTKSGEEDAPYFSFVRGRVKFVVTDQRSERSPKSTTDGAAKVVFSDDQRDWFFSELLEAIDNNQVVIWVCTKPWIAAASAGADHWGGYTSERTTIGNFITANNLSNRMAIVSGDMHALAYDDGTSVNNVGGIHVIQAAALDQSGSNKGGPYKIGPVRSPSTGAVSQYGVIDLIDTNANSIDVRFRGISVNRSTGSEAVEIDETFSLNIQ